MNRSLPSNLHLLRTASPLSASDPLDSSLGSTAIVHDWCPDFRGGERVLAELCRVTAARDIFTLFEFLTSDIKAEYFPTARFHTSIANALPAIRRYYRNLFFLCPFLIEQFDVTNYDFVISSSAAFARGVITRPDQPHLCYVHSPIRYAWDEQFSYLDQGRLGFGPKGLFYRMLLHGLRTWDTRTSHGPDVMLANSRYVRSRIRRVYGRNAIVVAPPVPLNELDFEDEKDDYYVTASFMAPYKRTDLVIKAFRDLPNRRLVVVGDGQQSNALRQLAGPNISFVGYLPRAAYVRTVARARALLFAGVEDFGIALAEAQGCGTPVIALARGGARDIVVSLDEDEPATGVLFSEQSERGIRDAIGLFERRHGEIEPAACRQQAERFSPDIFRAAILAAADLAIERNRYPDVLDEGR